MYTASKIRLSVRRENTTSVATGKSQNTRTCQLSLEIIKDIKDWELSNKSSKSVVKFYWWCQYTEYGVIWITIEPTIERTPGNVTLHCDINDLKISTDSE